MARKRIPHYLYFCAAALLAASAVSAAEHHGTVKFGGLPLPGVTVTATQGDKKFVALTDAQGAYAFPDLSDGIWNLQVEMQCFAPIKQEVAVTPTAPSPEWEMKLLPLDEIKASAPPPPPPSPTAAAPVTTSQAAGPGAPAAQPDKAAKPSSKSRNTKGSNTAAANPQSGFQRTDVNATSDGSSSNSQVGGMTAADASQSSDAFVVNGSVSNGVERRTIGNARRGPGMMFRGDFNANFENSYLDANSFSLTGQNTAKPSFNHFTFGGSFGGPLIIPHLIRGNGQFFVNYQATRNRNANTQTTLMPTPAERTGDFSNVLTLAGLPTTIYDPTTGQPFPNNVIPASRISPQARALLNYYPQPNFSQSAVYNYQVPIVSRFDQDDLQSRINKTLSRKDFLNGGFAYRNSRTQGPNIFGFNDRTGTSGITANTGWRHMFNQRINSFLSFNFSRLSVRSTPYFENLVNVSGEAGITGNDQEPVNWGPPSLSFGSNIATLSDANQAFSRNMTNALSYTMQWTRRPHNFTFGGDLRELQFNNLSQANARGSFGFTGAATQAFLNGVSVPGTGSDFADFLLGIPDTASIAFGNADKYFRTGSYDAYFTDDWRIGPGLTINAGMRWEYSSPITELYGRLVNLDIGPYFSSVSPVVANNPIGSISGQHYPDSLLHPDKHAFQPRLSFAWHPFFGSSLVVRGGYGIYYNTSIYQAIANQMAQQSPLSKSLSVSNSAAAPLTLANGFNGSPTSTPNTFAIDPNFRVGYSQNWQISVQRDLTEGIVATATYLGIKGTRAVQVFQPNTYPNGAAIPCPSCPVGYAYMTSNGNSSREAGQLQLQRRFHNGISATLQYTYSKSIDDAILGGRTQGSAQTSMIAQNWLDLSAERGLSPFDQRHLATLQAQYSTGVGLRGGALLRGWQGAIIKGWTLLTNLSVGSGLPETPVYVAAIRNTGQTGSLRPDYIGGSIYNAAPGHFLNSTAYAAPAAGQWGDAGRNSIIGPSQFSLGASMARTFHENLDLRVDASNALNHVTFGSWVSNISSSQFGLPAAPNAMRSLKLNLRWRF